MREKNPNPGARARFTTHEEVTTSRELTYRMRDPLRPAGFFPANDESFQVGTLCRCAVHQSPEESYGDTAVHVPLVREPFTWAPDHVLHTAEPSDTAVHWARG